MRFAPMQEPRAELLVPERLGAHVWIAAAVFRVSAEGLRGAQAGEGVHLDRENLATIEVGCYVCERPFSSRAAYEECAGPPLRLDLP